ncbi:MAG: branched-chain amino acid transaminase [Candidatus Burarchaeum sp.]|nr:branched-chain amino acid transaminase [Candidatus Burarchaeum sp.]MDO8339965.1 branched-chain amino acid transaminase [Candidatus Burarchaeum sp.]
MVKLGSMMAQQKCDWVWWDGKFVKWKEANVHITTWSLHYSLAIFEGIRSHALKMDGKENAFVFRLADHVRRLERGAKAYEIPLKYNRKEIEKAVLMMLHKNKLKSAYIRPILYFGQWSSPAPTKRQLNAEFVIFGVPASENLEKWKASKGISCMVSSRRKPSPDSLPSDVKCSANYATSYLAALEAERKGYDYAILLDHRGYVSEGLASNIFVMSEGRLVTPPMHASILGGITRDTVMSLAKDENLVLEERDITHTELLKAEEVFVTGTASDITPVVNIDGTRIGGGRVGTVTIELQRAFRDVLTGQNVRYKRWLTPVY